MRWIPVSQWRKELQEAWANAMTRVPWVAANPEKATEDARRAAAELKAARASLDAWKAKIGQLPADQQGAEVARYNKAAQVWYQTASGLYYDAKKKTGEPVDEIGILPLIVVGVIVLSAAGAAFAPAAYQAAKSLRVQADTQARDLDARIEASKEGRTLQPATVAPPSVDAKVHADAGGGGAGMIIGAVLLVAVPVGLYVFTRSSR